MITEFCIPPAIKLVIGCVYSGADDEALGEEGERNFNFFSVGRVGLYSFL